MRLTLITILFLSGCARPPPNAPVLLSVKTNPPTSVTLVPRADSGRPLIDLGHTPIDDVSGACAGDSVILRNPARGIDYEVVIPPSQPNEHHLISKVFK